MFLQPVVEPHVPFTELGITGAAGLVIPLAVARENPEVAQQQPGGLDIPALLGIGARLDGIDSIVDVPGRRHRAQPEGTGAPGHMRRVEHRVDVLAVLTLVQVLLVLNGSTQLQAGDTGVLQVGGIGGVGGIGLGHFLTAVADQVLALIGIQHQAGCERRVIAPAGRELTAQGQTALPPGGGDDVLLDVIALHPVERVRLVGLVENTHGDQEQARLHAHVAAQVVFYVGLLQFNFAVLAVAGDRVLQFHLGEHPGGVAELVPEVEHEAVKIQLVLVAAVVIFVGQVVVVHLAVAADLGALGPAGRQRMAARHQALLDHAGGGFHLDAGFLDLVVRRGDLLLEPGNFRLLLLNDGPHLLGRGRGRDGGGATQADYQARCQFFHLYCPLYWSCANWQRGY